MTIATLANLENQVKSFLHRADLLDTVGASNVDNLIELGEVWLFRHARTADMEATLSGTIDSNGELAVPTGYLALKHARIAASPTNPLLMRPSHWIYQTYPNRSAGGTPQYIARDGAVFIFGCYPTGTPTVAGRYYAKPTSIKTSDNAVFVANPDLYLFAALAEAEAFVKNDARVSMWIQRRMSILSDVNELHDEGQTGTGMAVRPDAYA